MAVDFILFDEKQVLDWFTQSGTTDFQNETEKNVLVQMLNGLLARCAKYCNREGWHYQDDFVEYIEPYGRHLYVRRRPVKDVTEIETIIPLVGGEYSEDNDILSTSYYYDQSGFIALKNGACWSSCKYQVTYNGGYFKQSQATSGTILPDDLAKAFLIQLRYEYNRRNTIGVQSTTDAQGTTTNFDRFGLLAEVRETLNQYIIPIL